MHIAASVDTDVSSDWVKRIFYFNVTSMRSRFIKNFFKDKSFWIAGTIGLVLMLLTLQFNINPLEGSVVPEGIRGTFVHVLLFISSMPAWVIGLIISNVIPVPFPVTASVIQFLLYGILGKMIHHGIHFMKTE